MSALNCQIMGGVLEPSGFPTLCKAFISMGFLEVLTPNAGGTSYCMADCP